MVKETYKSKNTYFNIGYYINKNVLIDIKNIKKSLEKKRIFKIEILDNNHKYISKELLALSEIGLFREKKQITKNISPREKKRLNDLKKEEIKLDKKNIPIKKNVYFENLLAKALTNYSFQWDSPINNYLRLGESYFESDTFKKYHKRYGNTMDESIEAIKNIIQDLDKVFLEAAPKNESSTNIFYRGMTKPFENLININDSIVVPNFISITSDFSIAIRFSGITKGAKCCLYKIKLSKGIPHIDMITTTKYKNEKEILLPRNLVFKMQKIEYINYPTTKPLYKIPIVTLNVSLQNNDQFKLFNKCKNYYLGQLISYSPKYLEKYEKSDKKIDKNLNIDDLMINMQDQNKETEEEVNNSITNKKILKRCPNGTRKNKITGLCEALNSKNKSKETKTQKNKDKLPRCPNGTRRNKITGNCEAK